ncbi:MAG: hypothetical protein LBD70_04280, partial [Bifidobacteriaceae bacterium]|nr:hypothetical protein [Bifidobacteriaceae bacterium]
RLSDGEKAVAQSEGLDYPIFMAVAEAVGHDKRGKTTFKRASDGGDLLVTREETVTAFDDSGGAVKRVIVSQDKVVDDDLPLVSEAFGEWLASLL